MDKYNQQIVFTGIGINLTTGEQENIIVVTFNKDTRSWTEFSVDEKGVTCVIHLGITAVNAQNNVKTFY